MDIKVNQAQQLQQAKSSETMQVADDTFKFTLASKLEDASLASRLTAMMQDIQQQGRGAIQRSMNYINDFLK